MKKKYCFPTKSTMTNKMSKKKFRKSYVYFFLTVQDADYFGVTLFFLVFFCIRIAVFLTNTNFYVIDYAESKNVNRFSIGRFLVEL